MTFILTWRPLTSCDTPRRARRLCRTLPSYHSSGTLRCLFPLTPPSCYRRLVQVAELSVALTAFSAFIVLQSRVSDRGAAEGSFSVLFVRSIAVPRPRTPSAVFSLSYRDRGSYKSRR